MYSSSDIADQVSEKLTEAIKISLLSATGQLAENFDISARRLQLRALRVRN